MKSVLAVLAGYLVFGISAILLLQISGVDPRQEPEPGFRIWSAIYGVLFAFAGGYVAGWIAGRKEILHASAVALLLAVIATVSLIAQSDHGSLWSQVSALVFMAPAAVLGGVMRARRVKAVG